MQRVTWPFWTAFFLILLRLAIGWHFLYEGYHKVHSFQVGPTTTNTPFSSAGYFREAHGPLGPLVRSTIGDPDDRLLERLDVQPLPPDRDPANDKKHLRMPPALAREWSAYFDAFSNNYHLDAQQQAAARVKLEQAELDFVRWLTDDSTTITKTFPSGTIEVTEKNAQRVAEYRDKVRHVRDVYEKELPAFGRDVEKARLVAAKAEVAKLRRELDADLNDKTAAMKKALSDVLTEEQKKLDPVAEPQQDVLLKRIDQGTAYFLFAVGISLVFGLFTRTGCLLAAGFLLMTYLSTPALPWLPVPPNQEGSYYFVSKNVVEMLALLALATTPSGRWFGLDGMVHQFWLLLTGRRG